MQAVLNKLSLFYQIARPVSRLGAGPTLAADAAVLFLLSDGIFLRVRMPMRAMRFLDISRRHVLATAQVSQTISFEGTRATEPNGAPMLLRRSKILAGIWMSLRAVSFFRMGCCGRVSSKNILSGRYWLKVSGVYAQSVSAEVVKLKALRNWTAKKLITKPVGILSESRICDGVHTVNNGRVLGVSHRLCALPVPACRGDLDVTHKQFAIFFNQLLHKLFLFKRGEICKRK